MKFRNRIRSCDTFGAPIELNFAGHSKHNTTAGGVASLLLKALILGYFVKQTV